MLIDDDKVGKHILHKLSVENRTLNNIHCNKNVMFFIHYANCSFQFVSRHCWFATFFERKILSLVQQKWFFVGRDFDTNHTMQKANSIGHGKLKGMHNQMATCYDIWFIYQCNCHANAQKPPNKPVAI